MNNNEINQLEDFERAEYYKHLYERASKSKTLVIVVFSLLSFTVGYLLAKMIYTHHHLAFFF